jgi:hypothetical protein
MNILIDINHPAHVHLLRNAYKILTDKGHQLFVAVKEIPSAMKLLDLYGIPYINIGKKDDALAKKGVDQLAFDRRLLKLVLQHQIVLGIGSSINIAHVSRMSKMKSIILDDDDDEVEPLFVKFGHPFADAILTPSAIQRKSPKAVYVESYHELAYLHPNRFVPDPSVLHDAGVEEGETFFILRFNAFKAHHDVGEGGLSIENKRRLVELLQARGKVFITTERDIDDEFKPYQLTVSPEKAHSLMYYAKMFVGDSQTMTSEAAVLGTPAVKCNSFAGRLAVPNELEQKYGLCYSFLPEQQEAFFAKIDELLAIPDLKGEWQQRRKNMLEEKMDYTSFLVWFIENYPESRRTVAERPDFQLVFR